MHLYEWLTLIALLAGPVMAILIQLGFEQRREDRRRKLRILDALMANRARPVSLEFVQALNVIDIVFHGHSAIRAKWSELFAEFERGRTLNEAELEASFQKRSDLIVELIGAIASSLGYSLSHTLLKGRRYNPQAAVDEDNYQLAARKAVLPILTGEKAIWVRVQEGNKESNQ